MTTLSFDEVPIPVFEKQCLDCNRFFVGTGGLDGDRKGSPVGGGGWKLPAAVTSSQPGIDLDKACGIGPP